MKLVTVAGPPSSGKTSALLRIIEWLRQYGVRAGVVKFDCVACSDDERYKKMDIPVLVGLSGNLCPDHFFVTNIEDCVKWGASMGLDMLISESAGLCNRCSPFIRGVLSVCVIDNLSGINTPFKIGPLLKQADLVLITKGDIVSQAERDVFQYQVRKANANAEIVQINGLTGQGRERASERFRQAPDVEGLTDRKLRFAMPAAVCSYCLGETKIGRDYQMGNVKSMVIPDTGEKGGERLGGNR